MESRGCLHIKLVCQLLIPNLAKTLGPWSSKCWRHQKIEGTRTLARKGTQARRGTPKIPVSRNACPKTELLHVRTLHSTASPPPCPTLYQSECLPTTGYCCLECCLYKNTMVGMETRSWGTLDPLRPYTLSLLSFPVGSSLSPSLHLGFLV